MTDAGLVLHLGAHRTGTTSLQAALDAAAEPLREAGIVALTPPGAGRRGSDALREIVRAATRQSPAGRIARAFGAQSRLRRRLTTLIDANAAGTAPRRVILSDETLLGPAFKRNGRAFYSGAQSRLWAFRDVCPYPVNEVHLTLRSYDTFLVSVYAMRAVYTGGLPDFDAIRSALTLFERGWPDLVTVLRDVFPDARLRLSQIETSTLEDRWRSLTGLDGSVAIPTAGPRANTAPTWDAIAEAEGRRPGSYDPDELVARHAGGTPFDPLTAEEKRALQVRYAEDLQRIAARGDIDPITPLGTASA